MSTIDARAIGIVLVAENRPLLRYARRLTSNSPEAADLVQTVVLRVLAQESPIETPDNMAAWLRTVLFRVFVDVRRRCQREIPAEAAMLTEISMRQPANDADLLPLAAFVDMD